MEGRRYPDLEKVRACRSAFDISAARRKRGAVRHVRDGIIFNNLLKAPYRTLGRLIDKKTGESRSIEDPKCLKYLMSAARYLLTTLAPANSSYDPLRKDRERVEVAVTRQRVTPNGAR
jgi:hypothetical protein